RSVIRIHVYEVVAAAKVGDKRSLEFESLRRHGVGLATAGDGDFAADHGAVAKARVADALPGACHNHIVTNLHSGGYDSELIQFRVVGVAAGKTHRSAHQRLRCHLAKVTAIAEVHGKVAGDLGTEGYLIGAPFHSTNDRVDGAVRGESGLAVDGGSGAVH